MTTAKSPLRVLQAQADNIAKMLKAAERGEPIDVRFAEKIAEARQREAFKVGVVMDDKVITIEMSWDVVRETSEVGLAEYILNLMRETRQTVQ